MIKAEELRIGNWVYDGDKTRFPMYIQTIGEDYVYLNFPGNEGDIWESSPEELQGIPLSEELLEKMGFRFNGYGLWSKTANGRKVSINIKREFVAIEAFLDRLCDCRCTCHGIKYLHDLQNLFYTISRKNLEVKL